MATNDGGPAFPGLCQHETRVDIHEGLSLRDYFAAHIQADDRLVKCIRAMDDTALLLFAQNPQIEREEWITETGVLCGTNVFAGKKEVEKVLIRLQMEANAIATVRYMQADAMLAERERNRNE